MPLSTAALRVVMRQVQDLITAPLDGVLVEMPEDASTVEAILEGPADTPFAGGAFHVQLVLTEEYPSVPPKAFFKTKIFHPNIAEGKGDVCVNTLKKDWLPEYGLRHVLQVIKCLLVEPNPESALNEEAGRLLLEDYEGYRQQAAMMSKVHAPRWKQQGGGQPPASHPSMEQQQESQQPSPQPPVHNSVSSGSSGLRDLGHANVMVTPPAPGSKEGIVAPSSTSASSTSTTAAAKAAEKKKAALRRI